jgi:hypothetical protein
MGKDMGHALAIDTLAYAKKLIQAGMPQEQAEVQAQILAEVIDTNLATKLDLEKVKAALKHDIELLRRDMEVIRADLKRDIEQTRSSLIKWIVGSLLTLAGLIVGQAAVIVTLLK